MTQQTELGVEIEAPTTAVAVIREPGINQLMALAIEKEGAIEVIERLAALRESEMAREAEHEFMQAFAEFKGRCPAIPRNKKGKEFAGKGGVKSYIMYAPLDTAQMIVDPILFGLGFSYWWTSEATAEVVVTTCHLRHVGGHERTSSMALPITTIPQSTNSRRAILSPCAAITASCAPCPRCWPSVPICGSSSRATTSAAMAMTRPSRFPGVT
jgi:hypothetical protein